DGDAVPALRLGVGQDVGRGDRVVLGARQRSVGGGRRGTIKIAHAVDRVRPGRETDGGGAGGDGADVGLDGGHTTGRVPAVGHVGVDVVRPALLDGAGQVAGLLGDDRGADRRWEPVVGGGDVVGRRGRGGEGGQGGGGGGHQADGGQHRRPAPPRQPSRPPDGQQHGRQQH